MLPVVWRLYFTLLYFPDVAAAEQLVEVSGAFLLDDAGDLFVDHVFVAREVVPGAQNADGGREAGAVLHMGEQEGVGRARVVRIVDDQVGFGDAVAEGHDFDVTIRLAANPFVAGLSEDQWLPVLELDDMLAAGLFFGYAVPGAVIEYVAVLQDFHESGTLVSGGGAQGVFQVSLENVHGAGHEGGLSADGQRDGIERAIRRAVGRGLGDLLKFGGGRALPLS